MPLRMICIPMLMNREKGKTKVVYRRRQKAITRSETLELP